MLEPQAWELRPMIDDVVAMIKHDPLVLKTPRDIEEVNHGYIYTKLVLTKY